LTILCGVDIFGMPVGKDHTRMITWFYIS